jgi:D-serine deaminase-like pyridoxal phosphate-dependent protein
MGSSIHFPVPAGFEGEESIHSPALLVFPGIVKRNIEKAIQIAGDCKRLRPHVKTHKMPEIVKMHLDLGIWKFKCSTLSELKMTADAGASDILLAYPVAGPAQAALFDLMRIHPGKSISVLVDNLATTRELEKQAKRNKLVLAVYVDLDTGMERTGIKPGEEAIELYTYIADSPHLEALGLHVYDGHIRETDYAKRESICNDNFADVLRLKQRLASNGITVPELICGGTPTFPVHARFPDRTLSPGTYVLWDYGYSESFGDLDFEHAAWLLTRVISKPGRNKLCLDLGHKALASEMKQPRVAFMELEKFAATWHNEEHLVIETERADEFRVGDTLHGLPYHICPTVALHEHCYIVNNGRFETTWSVVARTRMI